MADRPKKIYWDSCAWIGFINSERDKVTPLRSIWSGAERGKYEIWTSVYAYLEVINGLSPNGEAYPSEESDAKIDLILSQNWVKRVQVDLQIAKLARDLKRRFHKDGLTKRPDAIHLATALFHNVDELHTFDGKDLLHLNEKIKCRNGILLPIRKPGPEDVDGPLFRDFTSGANGDE